MANPYGHRIYPTLLDRLEANSIILPWSGCKIWMGYCTKGGYGKIELGILQGKGHSRYVHILAYQLTKDSKFVGSRKHPLLHSCNISCCWNPDHLSPGTIKQNLHDAIKNGRRINGWRLMHERKRQAKHLQSIKNER